MEEAEAVCFRLLFAAPPVWQDLGWNPFSLGSPPAAARVPSAALSLAASVC